jgi:hypothetical protein
VVVSTRTVHLHLLFQNWCSSPKTCASNFKMILV